MTAKREGSSPAERQLADLEVVFDALAHDSRRHILLVIRYRGGEMTAGEIANRFACSWPTTSRHLGVLVRARLLHVEKRGRERVYQLQKERLVQVTSRWFKAFE